MTTQEWQASARLQDEAMKEGDSVFFSAHRRDILAVCNALKRSEDLREQSEARVAELESQLSANANMVMVNDHRHDQLLAAEARVAEYERILADPNAVWANMLTGKIARPQALDHYEECKAMVEKLEEHVRVLRKAVNAALSADSDRWVEHLENALAATEGLANGKGERHAP